MKGSWLFRINIAISLVCLGVVSGLCYNSSMVFSTFAEQLSSALPSSSAGGGMMMIPSAAEGRSRAAYMLAASALAAAWFAALLMSALALHDVYLRSRAVQLAYQLSGTALAVAFDVLAGLSAATARRWQRFFGAHGAPAAAGPCRAAWLMGGASVLLVSLLYAQAVVLTLRNAGLLGRRGPAPRPRPEEAPETPARSSRSNSVEFELDPLATRNRYI
ncbi:hypothetical protein F4809DRAFT_644834 [Biscogniauxia mediterranea]|nr:hypothetical protein F4809DRAFT_644834 [Biscogniauxia mediterranea]